MERAPNRHECCSLCGAMQTETTPTNGVKTTPGPNTGPMPLREARAEFDRVYLERLLAATGGDIDKAAAIAEIHPKSFARLMRRYNLRRP